MSSLLDALLAPLGPAGYRDWGAAEPYLFRHVLDHAAAAERTSDVVEDLSFLLHPASAGIGEQLPADASPALSLVTELRKRFGAPISPALLALAAARKGMPDLAHRAANALGAPPLTWQPRWTTGHIQTEVPPAQVEPAVIKQLSKYANGVKSLAMSTDGRTVVCAGYGEPVHIWNVKTGKYRWYESDGGESAIGISSDGRNAVISGASSVIRIVDLVSGRDRFVNHGHQVPIVAIAISNGGTKVVSIARDGTIGYSFGEHWQLLRTINQATAWAIEFRHNEPIIIWGAANGTVLAWRPFGSEKEPVEIGRHRGRVASVAIADDLPDVVSCVKKGSGVSIWSYARVLTSLDGARPTVVATDRASRLIAVGNDTGSVQLWHKVLEAVVAEHTRHARELTAIAMSEDGRVVASADRTGRLLMWWPKIAIELDELNRAARPAGAGDTICAVALAPRSQPPLAVVGDTRGVAQVVELDCGTPLGRLCTGSGSVKAITFHCFGGRELARVLWAHGRSKVLDPLTGSTFGRGSSADVLATSNQVDLLRRSVPVVDELIEVVGSNDGSVILRAFGSKEPIDVLPDGHSGPVTAVVCGFLNGRPIAYTGGADGTVRVWDLTDRRLEDVLHVEEPVRAIDVTSGGDLAVVVRGELIAFRHLSAVDRQS